MASGNVKSSAYLYLNKFGKMVISYFNSLPAELTRDSVAPIDASEIAKYRDASLCVQIECYLRRAMEPDPRIYPLFAPLIPVSTDMDALVEEILLEREWQEITLAMLDDWDIRYQQYLEAMGENSFLFDVVGTKLWQIRVCINFLQEGNSGDGCIRLIGSYLKYLRRAYANLQQLRSGLVPQKRDEHGEIKQ